MIAPPVNGKRFTAADLEQIAATSKPKQLLKKLTRAVRTHQLDTVEGLLPFFLSLRGEPFTLKEHFHFGPMFRTKLPRSIIWKTGRQVGKTQSLAAQGCMLSWLIPRFRILYVAPLSEQTRRFSNLYIRPLIEESPVRDLFVSSKDAQNVLMRTFRNGSIMLFSYALLDANRVRGVSADVIGIDELQNMDPEHLPIIREVIAASKWEIMVTAGTPLTFDAAVELEWSKSSQAEWVVKCSHCSYFNIPSLDHDLEKMIGPWREDICRDTPAIICAKCGQPISSRPPHGRWVHRFPDRRWYHSGYHVPQVVMPFHNEDPGKWLSLLRKRDTSSPAKFLNEVLGESCDEGQNLVTEAELRRACTLPWQNNQDDPCQEARDAIRSYELRVLAIDWGGYGAEEVSFTVCAVLGMRPDGKIHVLWGKRYYAIADHVENAKELLHWMDVFRCHFVAHDYTGANALREDVMYHCGLPLNRIMPLHYVRTAKSNFVQVKQPTKQHPRAYFTVDKARSLLYTVQCIKMGLLNFFQYDGDSPKVGLVPDFLALYEEKVDTRVAGDIYRIGRKRGRTDDFAHAVNFGCVALWYQSDRFPNFAEAAEIAKLTPEQAVGEDEPFLEEMGFGDSVDVRGF